MMIGIGQQPGIGLDCVRIYVAIAAVDGRKSFDTLCEQVRTALGRDPLGGDLFVFRNRQANRVKVLFFDGSGLVLYAKRLERGTFRFRFPTAQQASITVTAGELMELLAGR